MGKKVHFLLREEQKHPECGVRVKVRASQITTNDPNAVTCLACLNRMWWLYEAGFHKEIEGWNWKKAFGIGEAP